MSGKFRIVAVPPGQAPYWVREAWVGLELPINFPSNPGKQAGVLGGKPENLGGFSVSGQEALDLLKAKNPKAASWWTTYAPAVLSGNLVFKREVCEEV